MTGSTSASIPANVLTMLTTMASGVRPVMPPGVRQELVELLTRLVVNPEYREAYCRALTTERKRLGVHRPTSALTDSGDIPELEIARNGFTGLTDEQLVDYATSPFAVNAIAEWLDGEDILPDLGHWYIQAGKRDVVLTPDDVERDRQLLLAAGGDSQNPVATSGGSEPQRMTSPGSAPRSVRWSNLVIPIAIAASLALAFVLGTQWPTGDRPKEVRLASVAVRGDVTRGIEDVAIDVTNGSDRRAFLTLVGLAPGRKNPALFYRQEGRYIEVPPRGKTSVSNLPPEFEGTSTLFVISTPVPAGGVVRDVAPPGMSAETAERDADRVKHALADLGIVADVKVVSIPAGKR